VPHSTSAARFSTDFDFDTFLLPFTSRHNIFMSWKEEKFLNGKKGRQGKAQALKRRKPARKT